MYFKPYHWHLAIVLFLAASGNAQESNTQPSVTPEPAVIQSTISSEPELTVEELINRGLQNNPRLIAAEENVAAARNRVQAARSMANPSLTVVAGVGDREARDEEIILSQSVDIFGKRRARANVYSAEVQRAEAESAQAKRLLIVSIKDAAAVVFASQETERLNQVQVDIAQQFRDAAARRAELGDIPGVHVQRIDLELRRAQNDWNTARAERLTRLAALNQLIGQTPETRFRVNLGLSGSLQELFPVRNDVTTAAASSSDDVNTDTRDWEAIRSRLMPQTLQRPDIASALAVLERNQAQIKVLQRERRPDIALQARRSSTTGSGTTALRAVVTFSPFDLGSNKRERRALEAESRAQEANINWLRSQAASQLEQAFLRWEQNQIIISRYRAELVPLTVDLLRKTQIGYNTGASSYLEVLEAQRTLRQVQAEYLQALVEANRSETDLESALGGPIPTDVAESLKAISVETKEKQQ